MNLQKASFQPFQMAAQIAPPTGTPEDTNQIKVIFNTGGGGIRTAFDFETGQEVQYHEFFDLTPSAVDLSRLNAGAPVLNSHQSGDLDDVLGNVVPGSASVNGEQGTATVQLSQRPDIAGLIGDIKAGIIRNLSVGYLVQEYDPMPTGDDGIPAYIARKWSIGEISFVAVPFDAGAQSILNAADNKQRFACIFNRAETDAAETQKGKKMPEVNTKETASATTPEVTPKIDEAAIKAAAVETERKRAAGIRAACAKFSQLDVKLADELIASGVDLQTANQKILDALVKADKAAPQTASQITIGESEDEKFAKCATDWLLIRSGQAKSAGIDTSKLDGGVCRGMTLLDLAKASLNRAGIKTAGMDRMQIAGRAFTMRTAANTTSDFPVLLENMMYKLLLSAYQTQPDTWSKIAATSSVADFRKNDRLRLGSLGALDPLNEHGEFKNKSINDARKESISIQTKGNIISVTRQTIINDDLNALSRLPTMLGRAAKLSIEVDFYKMLAENGGLGPSMNDGKPLFDAAHANIGTPSALTVAGLDADRVVMATQKDQDGNEILDIRPSVLLVPVGLGSQARLLNTAQYNPDVTGKFQMPNVVVGLFAAVVDTARLTGTRRYLFADKSIAPTIEVAFLDGMQDPYLESQDGWRIDGTEMKVRFDYGVAPVDYVGAVTNTGVTA
jgi:hypothetical protein